MKVDFLNDLKKVLSSVIPETSVIEEASRINGTLVCDEQTLDGLPSLVSVKIKTSLGAGSLIRTELWLPDEWCGVFVGTGNGGLAGKIKYGTLAEYVRCGYAVTNTDMGTSAGENGGIDNPDMWQDFGKRATHEMTVLSKALINAYYKKSPSYSYFVGSSTGGEQALAEAQCYPDDYDGIIAGVPANNRTHLHTYFLWNYVHLHPKGSSALFSEEEIARITDLAASFFNEDSSKIYVSFPWQGENTVSDFISYLKENTAFSDVQLSALRALYRGPSNPRTGRQIYNGMPIGSEIYACGIKECSFGERPPHFYPFTWTFGENYDFYSFDFDKDMDAVNERLARYVNVNSTDLSSFFSRGGRLLIFSGSADPCVPFPDAYAYYKRLCRDFGEKVFDFCRYFLADGKCHGRGGRGVDYLESSRGGSLLDDMREWRENGNPPEFIVGAMSDFGDVREPLRIYPITPDSVSSSSIMPSCDEFYLEK